MPSTRRPAALAPAVSVDEASVLSAARLGAGSVRGSVLTNVVAPHGAYVVRRKGGRDVCVYMTPDHVDPSMTWHGMAVEAEGAVLVNVTARRIKAARGAIVYNVVDDSEVGVLLGGVGVGEGGGCLSSTTAP